MCKMFYNLIDKLSWRSSKSHYFNPRVINVSFKKSIDNKLIVLNLMSYSSIEFEIENEENLFNLVARLTSSDEKLSSKVLGSFKSEKDAKEALQELRITLYMPSKLMAKYGIVSVVLFGMVSSLYCMINYGDYHHQSMQNTNNMAQIQNMEQNNGESQVVEQNNEGSQLAAENNVPQQIQMMHPGMTQKEEEEYLLKINPELAQQLSASRESAANAMKEIEKLKEMRAELDRQDEQRKILQEQLVKKIQSGGGAKKIEAPNPENYLGESSPTPQGADSILNKLK